MKLWFYIVLNLTCFYEQIHPPGSLCVNQDRTVSKTRLVTKPNRIKAVSLCNGKLPHDSRLSHSDHNWNINMLLKTPTVGLSFELKSTSICLSTNKKPAGKFHPYKKHFAVNAWGEVNSGIKSSHRTVFRTSVHQITT